MASMGRTRKHRKDLPSRMYFDHGAYYFVPKEGKKTHLGRNYGEAITKYVALVQPVIGRQRLSAVMDDYVKEKIPTKKPRTRDDYLDAIRRLRPIFGEMWPEDVEPKHIYQYLRLRGAPVRANREIAVLSNVMQQAIEMGLVNINPCRQVRRNRESPRVREVLDPEVVAFILHCPEWLKAYIELKMLTGLRQGDMLRLGLFNIRDDGLFVETGKRGKRLLFQWTPALRCAVDTCRGLRRKPSESRLFPITVSGLKSAWARAMNKYEGDGFAENDLRAKVASEAIDLGLDATSMLGHSSDAVTRRHYIRGTRKVSPLK